MNLLITGAWQQAAQYMPTLQAMGHETAFLQWESDALPCDPAWVVGIIGNGIFQHHPIEAFQNLRYIQLTSAGYDRVPMDFVQAHNITIHNARGVYSIPMAEFVLAGVLDHYKQLAAFHASQAAHAWEKRRGLAELYGKKVLIIGAGSIGTECAARFQAFGCTVIGIATRARTAYGYDAVTTPNRLPRLLPGQDIVVLTAPLTDATRGMIGAEQLGLMKDGALLVNVSRGGLVDQAALTAALQSGRISALLDVFEAEPLPADSPLWALPNVMITPHNSFVGEGSQERLSNIIFNNLEVY